MSVRCFTCWAALLLPLLPPLRTVNHQPTTPRCIRNQVHENYDCLILNRLAKVIDYQLLKLSNLFIVVESPQSDANVSQSEPAAATLASQRPQPSEKQRDTPFTLAARGKLSAEQVEECHRKVTAYVVKRLHPFSEDESPSFRYS